MVTKLMTIQEQEEEGEGREKEREKGAHLAIDITEEMNPVSFVS